MKHSLGCQCSECLKYRLRIAMVSVAGLASQIHSRIGASVDITYMGSTDTDSEQEIFNYMFWPCRHNYLVRVSIQNEGIWPPNYSQCPQCLNILNKDSPVDQELVHALERHGVKRASYLARVISILDGRIINPDLTVEHDGHRWIRSSLDKLAEASHGILNASGIQRSVDEGKSIGIIVVDRVAQSKTLYRLDYDRIQSLLLDTGRIPGEWITRQLN